MPVEIERKFRVVNDAWRNDVVRVRRLRQAYLTKNGRISIRIRIDDEKTASITIKTAAAGIARDEYEYPIPIEDAHELLKQCEGIVIAKCRHIVPRDGDIWEIDVFEGDNEGLIVAEVELPSADAHFVRPLWLGEEVTNDRRFYNAHLARTPYVTWPRSTQESTALFFKIA